MNARALLVELAACTGSSSLRGVRLVLSFVEHSFATERLGPVDELLRLIEPDGLSMRVLLALVRCTYRMRGNLLYYDYALEKVRQHLVNTGQPESFLHGLPYKTVS